MIVASWLVLMTFILATIAYAKPAPVETRFGNASWYGEELRGSLMANRQPFDPDQLTCATWHWPLGTFLTVRHGNKSVRVLVTDRGPNRRFPDRIVDLSHAAFSRLAYPSLGVIAVEVTPIR
jgi:rare lipoprotein A